MAINPQPFLNIFFLHPSLLIPFTPNSLLPLVNGKCFSFACCFFMRLRFPPGFVFVRSKSVFIPFPGLFFLSNMLVLYCKFSQRFTELKSLGRDTNTKASLPISKVQTFMPLLNRKDNTKNFSWKIQLFLLLPELECESGFYNAKRNNNWNFLVLSSKFKSVKLTWQVFHSRMTFMTLSYLSCFSSNEGKTSSIFLIIVILSILRMNGHIMTCFPADIK